MLLRVLFAVILLTATGTDVYAVHSVTVCGETCASGEQCNLANNLTCSNNPAITLNTGADLDFLGHTITCSGCSSNATGVAVTAANSTVEDSVGGGGVRSYPLGIECNYSNNSLVRNVHIDNGGKNGSSGIDGCRKVQAVVITNVKNYGIVNQDIGDSDYIKDSYILGSYAGGYGGVQYGIWLDGDGSGLVDHNVIGNTTTLSLLAFYTSSSLVVTNNMLFNQAGTSGLIGTGFSPPQMSGNVCGDPNDYNCGACISAGACEALNTPLDVP